MREIAGHTAGKIYLLLLLLSIVAMVVFITTGGTEVAEGAEPFLLLGWITMPLFVGGMFVIFWLVTYLVYFFRFWPYR